MQRGLKITMTFTKQDRVQHLEKLTKTVNELKLVARKLESKKTTMKAAKTTIALMSNNTEYHFTDQMNGRLELGANVRKIADYLFFVHAAVDKGELAIKVQVEAIKMMEESQPVAPVVTRKRKTLFINKDVKPAPAKKPILEVANTRKVTERAAPISRDELLGMVKKPAHVDKASKAVDDAYAIMKRLFPIYNTYHPMPSQAFRIVLAHPEVAEIIESGELTKTNFNRAHARHTLSYAYCATLLREEFRATDMTGETPDRSNPIDGIAIKHAKKWIKYYDKLRKAGSKAGSTTANTPSRHKKAVDNV